MSSNNEKYSKQTATPVQKRQRRKDRIEAKQQAEAKKSPNIGRLEILGKNASSFVSPELFYANKEEINRISEHI